MAAETRPAPFEVGRVIMDADSGEGGAVGGEAGRGVDGGIEVEGEKRVGGDAQEMEKGEVGGENGGVGGEVENFGVEFGVGDEIPAAALDGDGRVVGGTAEEGGPEKSAPDGAREADFGAGGVVAEETRGGGEGTGGGPYGGAERESPGAGGSHGDAESGVGAGAAPDGDGRQVAEGEARCVEEGRDGIEELGALAGGKGKGAFDDGTSVVADGKRHQGGGGVQGEDFHGRVSSGKGCSARRGMEALCKGGRGKQEKRGAGMPTADCRCRRSGMKHG